MTFARSRRLSGLVGVAVLAGLLAGVGVSTPATAADAAPSGSYQLNHTKLWTGQTVTLTEIDVTDDVTPTESLTREVQWGDGTSETLPVGTSTVKHRYTGLGSYAIVVTIADEAGNTAAGTFAGVSTVTVTSVPGTYKIQKKVLYGGEYANQAAVIDISGIPSGVTKGKIEWGDGKTTSITRTTKKATHYYLEPYTYAVSVRLTTAAGETTARALGRITLVEDTYAPKAWIKTPKNKNKVSSWKTLNGTVSDKGVGVKFVGVYLIQKRGKTWYRYTGKKWTKAKNMIDAFNKAKVIQVKPTAKNTWKLKVAGLKKGNLCVSYFAVDKNYNRMSGYDKTKWQKLTK